MEWLKHKLYMWNRFHCTWFWDTWFGVYIGHCCENHDGDCSTRKFFNCLVSVFDGKFHATYVAFFASLGCWLKYPKWMIKKEKDNK